MKRMAIIFSVLAVGMLILGLVEDLTNFKWAAGDQNPLFGNPNWTLNDGKVVLILGGFLVVASALMWFMALRRGQEGGSPRSALRGDSGGRPPGAALRKGQSDQQ